MVTSKKEIKRNQEDLHKLRPLRAGSCVHTVFPCEGWIAPSRWMGDLNGQARLPNTKLNSTVIVQVANQFGLFLSHCSYCESDILPAAVLTFRGHCHDVGTDLWA